MLTEIIYVVAPVLVYRLEFIKLNTKMVQNKILFIFLFSVGSWHSNKTAPARGLLIFIDERLRY